MAGHREQLELARLSLEGIWIGDSFGDRFFIHADTAQARIQSRTVPDAFWEFTDDTNMALSIYETLRRHREVHQDNLASSFERRYHPGRGYGPAMHSLFAQIAYGVRWRLAAGSLFDGQGSYGNGAAMRVAPIGAYFAYDLEKVVEQARKSAEVTHAHPGGIAGAIAVAVAAAVAVRSRGGPVPSRIEFLDVILPFVPESEVRNGIVRARDVRSQDVDHVVGMLGNGLQISAQDTVPFTLWCAGECLGDFVDAMWLTASARGDVDTNCAIVGAIVSLYVGQDGLPPDWIERCEPLPRWPFR